MASENADTHSRDLELAVRIAEVSVKAADYWARQFERSQNMAADDLEFVSREHGKARAALTESLERVGKVSIGKFDRYYFGHGEKEK